MEVSAISKDTGVSPRKVRPLVDMVRGKKVDEALTLLRFTPTPIAQVVTKTIKSAAANAENNYQMDPRYLRVVSAYAGDAPTMKRWRARPRGRASVILKRRSHVTVFVEEVEA